VTPLRAVVLASIVTFPAFSLAANLPRNVSPYNVAVCQPNAGCIHHTIYGHDYKVLSTDRFAVMVFLSAEGRYTRADVSITNLTPTPAKLSPEDFRIEALTSKSKVFPYVPPSQLENIPTPTRAISAASTSENPDISEFEAARQRAMQEAVAVEAAAPDLKAITIPPNQAIQGRVYFERDPNTKHQEVNVVLPIAGTLFKFPYIIRP
jgi:hypothetical protein